MAIAFDYTIQTESHKKISNIIIGIATILFSSDQMSFDGRMLILSSCFTN